jgi:hypothetical protein
MRIAQILDRSAGQNRVRETSVNARRAAFVQGVGDFANRAARIAHIVNYQTIFALNVADDVHHFGDVRPFAPLVA